MADVETDNIDSHGDISPKPFAEDSSGSTQGEPAVSMVKPKRGRKAKASVNPAPRATDKRYTSLPDSVLALPIKQRTFVEAIAIPESPTFGNQTQSALKAGYGNTYPNAANHGHDLANKPEIRNAINDLLDKAGLSSMDRTGILADLARQKTAEILHYDGDGKLTQRQVIDNGKLRLQAVREAAKLAGDYARAENVAKAQRDAIQPIVAHYAKQLRDALKAEQSLSPNGPHDATGGATVNAGSIGDTTSHDGSQTQPEGNTSVQGATVDVLPSSEDEGEGG